MYVNSRLFLPFNQPRDRQSPPPLPPSTVATAAGAGALDAEGRHDINQPQIARRPGISATIPRDRENGHMP